jgi:pilus assembly protein CpaC
MRKSMITGLALAFALALAPAAGSAAQAQSAPPKRLEPAGDGELDLPSTGQPQDVLRRLEMERGKSLVVRTGYSVKRVSVGDPAVMDVVVIAGRTLQFVAKSVGDTNVILWDSNDRLQAAIDVHVGTANTQVTSEIRRVLGNDTVSVEPAGESIVLRGTVPTLQDAESALRVAQGFFPCDQKCGIVNLISVGGDQQVMIEVKIAEMKRSLRRSMGTNFRALFSPGDNTIELFGFLRNLTALNSTGTRLLSDRVNLVGSFIDPDHMTLDLFMEILESHGLSKVLAEPTLVARSGDQAEFLVGGEVPIPIAQGGAFGSITIEYKPFGVGVKFTPTVLASEKIHLDVTSEVSDPDFTTGVESGGVTVPSFNTRRAATAIELGDGQSFAIAGLLRDDVTALVEKYPGIGDVPVLGLLFRSQEFLQNQTELVLIVTPRLVRPLPPGPQKLPTDQYVTPDWLDFFLLGRIEGRNEPARVTPPPAAGAPRGGMIGPVGHRLAPERQ